MKQLVILSGKGGTGKTAVTSSFAHLSYLGSNGSRAVFVDADVDAANLELLIGASPLEEHEFQGGEIAQIDQEICVSCGICQEVCRFDAVRFDPAGQGFEIDPLGCEGCATCFYQCPDEAIAMVPRLSGYWFRSESRFGPLFHARLRPAQENSGKLVALIKQRAREASGEEGLPLMVVDGPPGIACPAIAAVTGADMVLIVAEPTLAGIHDLKRAQKMAAHFQVETMVCVNKADLHPQGAEQIEEHCRSQGVKIVGSIPFDETVTRALVEGQPVTEYSPQAPASQALLKLWENVRRSL